MNNNHCLKDPIDIVYLWCDGDDPSFKLQKKILMEKMGIIPDENEELFGEKRFSNHDELKYSLRSVYSYLPWVNHIYIVTNKQIPTWLNKHPKLTIVDHTEIIPKEFLPTFSSLTIETYITKIKNLSEKFLYFNDDLFINRQLLPTDFFYHNKPIIWVKNFKPNLKIDDYELLIKKQTHPWNRSLLKAWGVFCSHNNLKVPYMSPNHNVDAYTKTAYDNVLKKYPELVKLNSSHFRTGQEISRHIFAYEMIYLNGCKVVKRASETVVGKVLCFLKLQNTTSVGGKTLKKLKKNIDLYRPNCFCINEIDQDKDAFISFLQTKFPHKAPWEK